MRIAIDCSRLDDPKTGIHRYLSRLLTCVADGRHEWVELRRPREMRRLRWMLRELPRRAAATGAHLLFAPHFWDIPSGATLPVVAVVQDVWPLEHPVPFDPHYWRHRLFRPIEAASGIICISDFSRAQLLRLMPRLACPIRTVHLTPSEEFTPEGPRDLPASCPERFFLAVLSQDPRKNIPFLEQIVPSLPFPLVVAGGLDDSVLRGAIKLGPFNDDDLLARLYRRAEALLFPSLYEGFGYPPVEAAKSGCPVLAADLTSLSEILAGYPGLLPLDPALWTKTATALTADSAMRERFISTGFDVAARFSPAAFSRGTVEFLEDVAMGGTSR